MFQRILVTTDGSQGSQVAVDYGESFGQMLDCEVCILYVVDVTSGSQILSEVVVNSMKEMGFEVTENIVEKLEDAGVEADGYVEFGPRGQTIIDFAENNDIDLIIMSTHGRTGVDRFLIGSVTEKVIRNSKIPVLTVEYNE